MLTLKEKVEAIKNELKENKITSKQVSVRGKEVLYDGEIKINIKDISVKIKTVQEIVNKYKEVDKDINGEVLRGGNTYILVDIDYKTIVKAREEFLNKASELMEESKGIETKKNIIVTDNGLRLISFSPVACNGNPSHLKILERPKDYKTKNNYCYNEIKRFCANSAETIAEALMMFKYQYDFNL